MSDNTAIEWTHRPGTIGETWNPTTGCDRVSPGCDNCYAMKMASRLKLMGQAKYQNDGDPRTSGPGFGITSHWDALDLPLRWKTPRTVFVNSMSDLFHARIPDDFIAGVWATMAETRQHTYQILTKRPGRMARLLGTRTFEGNVRRHMDARRSVSTVPPQEETREIDGYPGYFVSNLGNVYSTTGRNTCAWCDAPIHGSIKKMFCTPEHRSKAHYEKAQGRWTPPAPMLMPLSADANDNGHLRVALYVNGEPHRELVHRLVLTAFVRPPTDGELVRHLDSNPANNAVSNLAWGSYSGNVQDRIRHGRPPTYSKLIEADATAIRRRGAAGESAYRIAKDYPVSDTQVRNILNNNHWRPFVDELVFPLPGVWLGTSIELDKYVGRADDLRATNAAVRFLSLEPLLGPLPSLDLTGIDWAIIGGESGPGSRPMGLGWVRELIVMAREAGTAVFVKQLGSVWAGRGKGGDWSAWPEDLRIREYPGGVAVPA